MKCRLCGAEAWDFGHLKMLHSVEVSYFRCTRCEYVQTEQHHWLEAAYSSALSALDVGAVSRNKRFEVVTQAIIQAFLNSDGRYVDYGGGHGLFVRLMRDRGFDFLWSDKYAENLYARGFEHAPSSGPLAGVTAFEVFEHLVDPAGEIAQMLAMSASSPKQVCGGWRASTGCTSTPMVSGFICSRKIRFTRWPSRFYQRCGLPGRSTACASGRP